MKGIKIIISLLIIYTTSIQIIGCNTHSFLKAKIDIKGKWTCIQDTSYNLIIDDKIINEIYENLLNDLETFSYSISKKNCGIKFNICSKNCIYLIKKDSIGDEYCYLIKDISDYHLTLIYEGGEILDFKQD